MWTTSWSTTAIVVGLVWKDILGIEFPELTDDFVLLGGDSLSALATTKRLLEWDGIGAWPEDGVVQGPLAVKHLLDCRVLKAYADFLEQSGITKDWTLECKSVKPAATCATAEESSESEDITAAPAEKQPLSEDDPEYKRTVEAVRRLRFAAATNDLQTLQSLLASGANPNGDYTGDDDGDDPAAWRPHGVPPLHAAAHQGHAAIVDALLAAGARPNCKMFFYKRSPLHCAALAGSDAAVAALLAAGAAPRARDKARLSVLHDAARGGNPDCVRRLLAAGAHADLEARDKWGRTALHWTVLKGHTAAARELLAAGASAAPPVLPRRIQRRRTSLQQPVSLRALAEAVLPAGHPIIDLFPLGLAPSNRKRRADGRQPQGDSAAAAAPAAPVASSAAAAESASPAAPADADGARAAGVCGGTRSDV